MGNTTAIRAILSSLALLASGCGSPSPLPPTSDIASMKARIHDRTTLKEFAAVVPPEYWPEIIDALLPATRDFSPAKSMSIGDLQIEKKDGGKLLVVLFPIPEGPAAFAVGQTPEARVYYRGGNSQLLQQALHDAFQAASENSGL